MFSSRTITPDTISGLTGWWDAGDASTLYDATTGGSLVAADGAVARLQDKSGNNRHFTQATSGSRPERKASIKNGLDVLRFNGSSSQMGNTATYSQVMALTQSTVFIVASATAVTTNNANIWQNATVLAEPPSGTGHGFAVFRSNNTVSSFGYDSAYRTANVSYTAGNWAVFTTRHGSATLAVRVNGGTEGTVALGKREFFSNALSLGVNHNSDYFDGDLGEIVVYNVALSDADMNAVESYLQNKWGI
jgi:hypothetical protein